MDDFNELRFGTEVEDTSDWMMNSAQFLERAKKERMWIFGTKENIQDLIKNNPHLNLTIIDQTKRDLIAVNFDAKPFESLDK